MEAAAGDTAIAVKLAAALVMFRVAVPRMVPDCAVMVTTPMATPLAIPALLTEATLVSEELHCAEAVTSLLLPSENFPVAVNGCVAPVAIEVEPGDTCKAVSEGSGGGLPEPDCPPPLQAFNSARQNRTSTNEAVFTLSLRARASASLLILVVRRNSKRCRIGIVPFWCAASYGGNDFYPRDGSIRLAWAPGN